MPRVVRRKGQIWLIYTLIGIGLSLCLISLLVFLLLVEITNAEFQTKERYQIYRRYLEQHNCEQLGNVNGKYESVYKCDNGLWLESEILREMNK